MLKLMQARTVSGGSDPPTDAEQDADTISVPVRAGPASWAFSLESRIGVHAQEDPILSLMLCCFS